MTLKMKMMPLNLSQEWKACRAIVLHALLRRSSQGSNWLSWTFLVLAVLVPAFVGLVSGQWKVALGYGAGPVLSVLGAMWWYFLCSAVVAQRGVGEFRLAPGFARRASATLLIAWLALTLVLSALLALAFPPSWIVLAACTGASLAVLAAMLVKLSIMFAVLAAAFAWLGAYAFGWIPDLGISDAALVLSGAMICIVCGIAIRQGLRGTPRAHASAAGAALGYARRLRIDLANGRTGPLLMHAVGPRGNLMPAMLVHLLNVVVFLSVFALVFQTLPGYAAHAGLFIMVLVGQFGLAQMLVLAIYASHREQALVRLAPAVPNGRQFNSTMSRALLVQFFRCWLVSSALALGLLFATGVTSDSLMRLAAVFCMSLLAAGATQRDYARAVHSTTAQIAGAAWVLGALVMGLAALIGKWSGQFWIVLAFVAVASAAAFALYRQRGMLRGAVAFPAGRAR